MRLYKITALKPLEIQLRQYNSNVLYLRPEQMPKTDAEAVKMIRPPEELEDKITLTENEGPVGDVIEIISLRSKDDPAGKVFRWSDFQLPAERGDRASYEGLIQIERTQ